MRQDLILDPSIRDWVLIPIVFVMVSKNPTTTMPNNI